MHRKMKVKFIKTSKEKENHFPYKKFYTFEFSPINKSNIQSNITYSIRFSELYAFHSKLLNKYKPVMIIPTSTSIEKDTPLYKMSLNGEFIQPIERELVEEELTLIENLEMYDDCYFFGGHVHNLIKIGYYFQFKDEMIKEIKKQIIELDEKMPELLDSKLTRGHLYVIICIIQDQFTDIH